MGDLTVADTIAELATEMLAHAPPKFALAGLSMGGYVAMEIMRQAPDRVQGLALMNTSARSDTPEATANRRNLMELAQNNFQLVLDNLMPKLVHPSRMIYNSIVDTVYSMGHRIGKDAFMRQQRAIIGRIDSRPSLANIKNCPTLILGGREDLITPLDLHEEMAAAIAGSHLQIIANCAHLSAIGEPKRVSEAIRAWLRGIEYA